MTKLSRPLPRQTGNCVSWKTTLLSCWHSKINGLTRGGYFVRLKPTKNRPPCVTRRPISFFEKEKLTAALLAQKGHSYYDSSTLASSCSNQVKTKITVYGAISSYLFWTWTYVNGSGNTIDGYNTTVSTYDNYLKLNPPPSFPTTGSFSVLNFRELLENP